MSAIVRSKGVMPSLRCERSAILLCGLCLALANALYAQSVGRLGEEFPLNGRKGGDQSVPQIAIGRGGGYLVWQDNGIDGPGKSYGIGARKLGQDFSPISPVFRVNQLVDGLQENPSVTLMTNGGAAFVWQGGKMGAQDIYLRMHLPTGELKPKRDLLINPYTKGQQSTPVITTLSNGNFAVVWCSLHEDKHLHGVYARIVTPTAQFPKPAFRVNQFTSHNQKSPAITTLSNGHFVVVWASANQGVSFVEAFRHTNRVHIYGRVFTRNGKPVSDEFRVNTSSNICGNPSVAQWGDKGFTVTWAERAGSRDDGWDIYARTFSAFDAPLTDSVRLNDVTYGDQFLPKIASVASQHLVVWNSLGHDGSDEGVFGRALENGQVIGSEFLVNTHTNSSQIQPVLAARMPHEFLVVWSSYMGDSSLDVRGQRFVATQQSPENITSSGSIVATVRSDSGTFPPLPPTGSGSLEVTPVTPSSVPLLVTLGKTTKGNRLSWNAEAGRTYQVQYTTNLVHWENLGQPRLAVESLDSVPVGSGESAAFYRVIRVQ